MAKGKSFKATWLGDGDPSSQVIFIGGHRFIKGDPTDVDEDISVNGLPFADTIRGNPMFAIDDTPDIEEPGEDEIAAMKRTLDERGVKYRSNISGAKLRDLIADTEPAPSETVTQNAASATQG